MLLKFLPILALFLWMPQVGHTLTSVQCQEILSVYGVTPIECASSGQPGAMQSQLSGAPRGEIAENHVFFPSGGAGLDNAARLQVGKLADILNGDILGSACLHLIGHSDTTGGNAANQKIGLDRANAVRNALDKAFQGAGRVTKVSSAGESRPLSEFDGRSRWQRRVEIRARNCSVR